MTVGIANYVEKSIIALVIMICCACREVPGNRVVIPYDYSGNSVAIVFNHADGALIEQVHGRYTFVIPADGILKVSNDFLDLKLVIQDTEGNPVWNDGNVKTFTATSLCTDFSSETFFIYRSNLVTQDSVALNFKYDACN